MVVAAKDHDPGTSGPLVSPAVRWDVSPPLSGMAPAPAIEAKIKKEHKKNDIPLAPSGNAPDTALQSTPGAAAAPATSASFDGIGVGLGTYSPRWAPPDTEGAVGPSQYFEIVNADIAIFSKSGALIYGPVPTNTIWAGFGGSCQNRDDGDGIVEYDRLADRWVVTQLANDGTNTECVAVSTTSDPTGAYARYAFTYPAFPDYPKLAVWPDAYYITFNLFGSTGFAGAMVCAYDRTKMLIGQAAVQQCYNVGTSYGGLLPSDLDGSTPPPAGSPDFVLNYGSNRLNLWKFHVDWVTPTNSTLSGPTAISVASFSAACGGGTCIPQPSTSQKLDSLADRLMSRLAYRNFGDHESLVVNHSVGTGFLNLGPTGVRWYELRNPNGSPSVYQQGTYAPDSTYRWMGSTAMDRVGDIALGYSASSSSVRPSVRYTGHLVSDALGVMGQGEGVLQAGSGSQLPSLSRWGDYTSMTVDPTDDCTFWYVGEYLKADGTWNWSTRIGSFRFSNCSPAVTPDFSITANPTSLTIAQGASGTSTISTAVTAGTGGTVSLTAGVAPTGPTASISPSTITAGGRSTLTVDVGSSVAPGTYTVTVTGTEGSNNHPTTVSVTVTAAAAPTITSTDNAAFTAGSAGAFTVTTTGSPTPTIAETGGLPSGVSLTDNHDGTATLAGIPGAGSGGTYAITMTAANGVPPNANQSFTITVDQAPAITSGANATFSIGSAGNFTVATTGFPVPSLIQGGSNLPGGVTFTDNGNGTGSLKGTPAPATDGTYNLTFTAHNGVGSDAVQTFTLVVQAAPTGDFSLALTPTTKSVRGGRSVSYTVTVTALNGFSGAISLSVTGLPSGSSGSFSLSPVTPNPTATSILTINTAPTPRGTFTFTVTGTSGGLTRTTTGTLQVTKR